MNHDATRPYRVGEKSYTAVAINTASIAGEWLKTKVGNFSKIDMKSSSKDLVTEVDQGAEALIRNLIRTYFPTHSILGEEGVQPGREAAQKAIASMHDAEYLWIVDPIDGTLNFIHGFPYYCISIGLAHRGELIVGVIYDPNQDEMFVAEKGKGAYLRGKRIHVSKEQSLEESLLATGFGSGDAFAANVQSFQHLLPQVRNVRAVGSAALHLAYVACGRLSGYWQYGLNVWNVAAGVLLVQEAGGNVTDIDGNPYHLQVQNIMATNGHIHDALSSELNRWNTIDETQ